MMTIPNIIQKTYDRDTVTSVKKAFSTISGAYMQAVANNGPTDTWDISPAGGTGALKVENYFKPYLNIANDCGLSGNDKCFANGYKLVSGDADLNAGAVLGHADYWATVTLNDGMALAFYADSNTTYGYVVVDINGLKGPNKFGADTFWFYFNAQKIYPMDSSDTSMTYCDRDAAYNLKNGRYCTAWVLRYENIDYLHCDGLNWTTKNSCN